MERKLATIQKITTLNPIENADQIEVASILGWKVVVRKGDFKIGDHCVYIEIDSLLPNIELFEFMKPRNFRVRTIRLRQQISQGLCIPINDALMKTFNFYGKDTNDWLPQEGKDITEILHIEKYEPQIPACLIGKIKGHFPTNICPKTDETRIQLLQEVLTRYEGTKCYITEKLDGSSCTYYYKDGIFGVCSRNLDLLDTEGNAFWEYAKEIKLEERMRALGINLALQGELVGNGIQKNNLKISGKKVLFFNVFLIDAYRYLDFEEFKLHITSFGLETVPIIDENYILESNIDNLVKLSIAKSQINPNVYREGIVIRPLVEKMDMQMAQGFGNGRLSFKVINPEYLLKYEE